MDYEKNRILPPDIMRYELYLTKYLTKYYGTGSYPEPPHGWHLKIRFTARYNPFTGPCFFRASTAYCEHVGVNLHDGGVNGEIQFL